MSKRKPPRPAASHRKKSDNRPSRSPENEHPGQRRHDGGGAVWLFGRHAVESALRNPARTCRRLLVTGSAQQMVETVLQTVRLPRPAPETVDKSRIDAVVPEGAVHQGMALQVAPLPAVHVEDLVKQADEKPTSTLAVVDQGTDPRNVGAVLRSAAAFGVEAVIVQDRHAPEATGALAKAASGALETVPLVRATNLARALDQLKGAGYWTVGLAGETETSIGDLDWPEKAVIVLGAEDSGLRRLTREYCDFLVRIPIRRDMESLNLSNAAAIAFYAAFAAKTTNS
ncbi:MAG: 23S rRNA (guanosine(2251)-2'-O)-methyltransferase RlmB [Rhodospirillales bacterium]